MKLDILPGLFYNPGRLGIQSAALTILLVEDDLDHAEAIRRALQTSDMNAVVHVTGTLREYREAVAADPPDVALINMILPDGRALDVLTSPPDARPFPILIITSGGNEQMAMEAMKAGALDYIVKSPEAFATIPHAVKRALREWKGLQERLRAEAALRESEERFRSLYENSTLGLYRTTPDGRIMLANPALVKMLGYSSFEDLSRRDLNTDGFEPSYPRARFVERVKKEGAVKGLESAWERTDGTTVFVRESAQAIRDAEGRILYFDGTVEDITDRKRAEEALAYEQSLLSALMDNSPDQVYFKDADSRFVKISKAQAERFGLSDPAQAVGKTDADFFAADHARPALEDEQRVMITGRPLVDLEEMETWPDGRVAWVSTTKVPLRDGHGRVIGTFGISRDITERKRGEERLKETLQRLRLAITSTIRVISMMVEARDPYTAGHQQRTTVLAEAIAVEMGLSPEKIEGLRMAGHVHDVGKISVPAEILSKPTRLTPGEFKLVKTHAQKGHDILKDVEFPWPLAEIVYQHHERFDGSGYPRGLKGAEILMEARILAVSDTVEAMSSNRPYRPSPGLGVALEEIEKNKGVLFDADVAAACLKVFKEKGFRFEG
ncbi:MAG: HD domain-containing phosphohydrolase [Candidatus Aminicenantales bacterium]